MKRKRIVIVGAIVLIGTIGCYISSPIFWSSALSMEIMKGNDEKACLIAENHKRCVNVTGINSLGGRRKPLETACWWSGYNTIKKLIEAGADIHQCQDGLLYDVLGIYHSDDLRTIKLLQQEGMPIIVDLKDNGNALVVIAFYDPEKTFQQAGQTKEDTCKSQLELYRYIYENATDDFDKKNALKDSLELIEHNELLRDYITKQLDNLER